MKRLVILLSAVMAMICSMGAMASGVGVIDMEQIFRSSPEVKKINEQLKDQFASRKSKIIEMGKTLQGELQGYQKNKAVMSKDQVKTFEAKISKKEADLRGEQMQFQKDLYAAQNKRMGDFMNQVRGIVTKVADSKKLELVLPKNVVLYSQGATDITSEVMSKLK